MARREFVGALLAGQVVRVHWSVVKHPMTRSDFGNTFYGRS